MAAASGSLDCRRLLPVAIGLPALIAALDHVLLQRFAGVSQKPLETALVFGLFIVEVGLVGVIVGRLIPVAWLRWTLYGWILLLIDLQVGVMTSWQASGGYWKADGTCLSAALFSGQFGLVAVWAVVGVGRWYWRWPAMFVLAGLLAGVWTAIAPSYDSSRWTAALIMQSLAVVVICGVLRFFGFRLRLLDSLGRIADGATTNLEPMQFQIAHVLVWTTALAIVMGIAKALDLLTADLFLGLYAAESTFITTLGVLSAMVIVVALWTALGQGSAVLRYVLLICIALATGGGTGWYCDWKYRNTRMGAVWSNIDRWYEIGWWWLAWFLLAGGFLVASLLIFRAIGCRLVRQRRADVANATPTEYR